MKCTNGNSNGLTYIGRMRSTLCENTPLKSFQEEVNINNKLLNHV